MTAFSLRARRRGAAIVVASLIAVSIAASSAPAASIGINAFLDCTEGLLKQASPLIKKRSAALIKCANGLVECKLGDELGSGDYDACKAKVVVSCDAALTKLAVKDTAVATKLAKSCSPLADHDFTTSVGIGMRRSQNQYGFVTTEAQAYTRLVDRMRCRAADIAEAVVPRAFELLDSTTIAVSNAAALSCLDERAPVAPVAGNPEALVACQEAIAKSLTKPFVTAPKTVSACISGLLECRLRADRLLFNQPQPPGCYLDAAASCGKAEAKFAKGLATEALAKASDACSSIPVADLLTALNFESECSGETDVAGVLDCVRDIVATRAFAAVDDAAPRTCQLSKESGDSLFALGNFCSPECGNNVLEEGETCDDGNGDTNDTCTNDCETGPTVHQSYSLPASRHPAHTPDGTAGNAVPVGSTVAVQFGTTTPDLNNVAYVRYRALGAGDPDAVLVLVPGFAGGAHSLKIVAETMVAKAAAAGSIVLEVWAFDRRTDQLEDDAGAILAESDDDPELAMNWYFGSQLGLALDPRLSRRAVFHAGNQIPFIANFTYNMFIHDIDDVINAAHALPSSPNVFLGGHSLGTLFSARYAATDLDPGAALEAGYTKIDGLVFFEGNGESIPTGPPSDDALDLVISKADGGLYHAVKNGDSRCWDGTACLTNADCSGVALAPGAFTNKCVAPVPAYAGGVISPEIHAVGDAVILQAQRSPDSVSIAQKSYGSGSAVQIVPGLSLLNILPRASSESSVGFFLDDDYSPEVSFQASMGFSTNGVNDGSHGLGDFYLAQPSSTDPYRIWKTFEWPMPAAALTDHGAPTGPFDLNGFEKEVTPMASVLTMVRSGDRNIGDWYFPASGLGLTFELIVGVGGFTGGLDSTPLSVGRGRPDIENLTQGANIDIPVIAFGGSNGISNTPGAFLPFAESIATCTAASCDGTSRILASDPVTPTYGSVAGGFEAYISEGYAHIDVVAAEDNPAHNQVYAPLLAFLERNTN